MLSSKQLRNSFFIVVCSGTILHLMVVVDFRDAVLKFSYILRWPWKWKTCVQTTFVKKNSSLGRLYVMQKKFILILPRCQAVHCCI